MPSFLLLLFGVQSTELQMVIMMGIIKERGGK